MERGGWKPHVEICPACPRCGSSNTKFCYYNNYSLTQPRYFCKGCRRYWTKGGSLRSIPVGGGCRKTRRGKAIRISRHVFSSRTSDNARDNCNSLVESSSHAASSNNIDLAVVYANFLNQQAQPEPSTLNDPIEILPMLPGVSNPPVFEFSNVGTEFFGSTENCAALSDWSLDAHDHSKDLFYICGLEKKQENINIANDQSKYELPPLPGKEVIATKDNMVDDPNQISNGIPFLGFESEADIDRRPRSEFIGNTSMFVSPTYGTTAYNFDRP